MVKTISKMGISTIQSYCGAQIFEAVGLHQSVIDKYFTWTPSRIGGIGLDVIAEEAELRHAEGFPERLVERPRPGSRRRVPVAGGRRIPPVQPGDHPQRCSRPAAPATTQLFKRVFRSRSTTRPTQLSTLRGLLEFKFAAEPDPARRSRAGRVDLPRFKTGAMCYGSISQEAHEALAIAMNRIGGKSNTGEGGEDPARYRARCQRRFAEQRHQAGGLGALRRDQRVPGQRRRTADQDGPGRQARRRRPAARPQGLPLDRQGPPLDARRGADLAAAAP